MTKQLKISIGQASDKGRKAINQDFHGVYIPKEPLLTSKGIAISLADGISSSEVSQHASEIAVKSFLEDYYCTPESWTVKTAAQRVLKATNSWLYLQTRNSPYRFSPDRGYVCTFTALILKSNTAHIFHAGDTRVYRLINDSLEQLTEDHRLWVSNEKSYLRRALGMKDQLELDYHTLALDVGDIFLLATDGVYEFASKKSIQEHINKHPKDLDKAASLIVDEAFKKGSDDNLSIQLVRIEQLPQHDETEVYQQLTTLPFPPELKPRMRFDGYKIIRDLHRSSRSHIYLANDEETQEQVILKIPSVDQRNNTAYLERFLMEEWVARRISNAHVLKPCLQTRKRNYLYVATEFIKGQTLKQWMIDHPKPDIEDVRNIIEQIAAGLRAFHRQEMLHQDIRPDNIMIDDSGTVKIIDFGSTKVAGLTEVATPVSENNILGTAQYTAPEYFLGEAGSPRSDIFSLGVICYQMLSGKHPYGTAVAKSRTKAAQRRLKYRSVLDDKHEIPAWIDEAIKKAVHPDPNKRYEVLSEFIYDLRHPNKTFLSKTRPPLMERNPVVFWQSISLILTIIIFLLLARE
ncbi:MAG TPA: bifunctional protein-serine/threonine kinase/phosphatase [Gammaproteobacteria bacterium]|nr:bifunctional protein-serine/threonine kinase/phosphatase [Gammaproteobacteria bacterium]